MTSKYSPSLHRLAKPVSFQQVEQIPFQREDRNVEAVAEAHETACLVASIHVERTRDEVRLVRDDAHDVTVHTGETDDHVAGEVLLDFKEAFLVGESSDDFANIVALLEVVGDDFLDFLGLVDSLRLLGDGRLLEVRLRQLEPLRWAKR